MVGPNPWGDKNDFFERLEQILSRLPEPARLLAEQILELRSVASARVAQIEALTLQAMKTRYHGDYHLGQVLVARDDVIIIDFEGEPSRSLAERRAKHSPLRDVVGMLRSFNYAAHAALRQATADGTCDPATFLPHVNDWERQTRAAFLEGYVEAVGNSPGYPTDPDQVNVLLELFTLEKACYELRYELDNRPDWVSIPWRDYTNDCPAKRSICRDAITYEFQDFRLAFQLIDFLGSESLRRAG